MQNKVAPYAATPDPTFGRQAQGQTNELPVRVPEAPNGDPVDLRLIIEEDKASGSYVYTTVNRVTGEVIQQLPRAEILRMKDTVAYVAGDVVRAKA